MKKCIIALLLILSLLIALCACGGERANTSDGGSESKSSAASNDGKDGKNGGGKNGGGKIEQAKDLIKSGKYEDAYRLLRENASDAEAQKLLSRFFWAPKTVTEQYDGRTVEVNTYQYNNDGNVTRWVSTSKRDEETETQEYKFVYAGNGDLLEGYPYMSRSYLCKYEYSGGQAAKMTETRYGESKTTEYTYNEQGLPVKASNERGTYDIGYTFYDSGAIKSVYNTALDLYASAWYYNEDGSISKVVLGGSTGELRLENGEYGPKTIELYGEFNTKEGVFTFTYDKNGALTKMTAQEYDDDGSEGSTDTYVYSDMILIYSENASVIERAKTLCFFPINEFGVYDLVEIVW